MTLENISDKKQELAVVLDKKISLINELVAAEKEMSFLILADDQVSISAFPIESILHIPNNKRKNMLSDLNRRRTLLKSCHKVLDELDSLDGQVKLLVLDLVMEKIKLTLESK